MMQLNDNLWRQRLIETVYQHPILYDTSRPDFVSYKEKDRVWDDIGILFNESGSTVKVKWRTVITMYRKYLRYHNTTDPSQKKVLHRYRNWQWAPYMEPFRKFATAKMDNTNNQMVNSPVPRESFISIAEFNVADIMCKQELPDTSTNSLYEGDTDPLEDPEHEIPEQKYNIRRKSIEEAEAANRSCNETTFIPFENGVATNPPPPTINTEFDNSLVVVSRTEDIHGSSSKKSNSQMNKKPAVQENKPHIKQGQKVLKKIIHKKRQKCFNWNKKPKPNTARQNMVNKQYNLKSIPIVRIHKLDTKKLNLTTTSSIKVSGNTPIKNSIQPPQPLTPPPQQSQPPELSPAAPPQLSPAVPPAPSKVPNKNTPAATRTESTPCHSNTNEISKQDRKFSSTELIFLGYANILESMPPDIRVMAKIKIADIMMNEELLHVQKST